MNTSQLPSIENKLSQFLNLSREFEKYSDEELVIKALQITPEVYKEKVLNQNESEFKRVCSAPIHYGCIYFRCYDCNQDPSHAYCINCMDKEKHKNHVITYHYSGQGNGFCDCGDNRILNKETCCDRHSQTEIKQWTPNEHFGEDFIKTYEEFLMLSFSLLFKLIDQIVDYPYKYLEFVELLQKNAYDIDKNSCLFLPNLKESEAVVRDILKVNDLIFKILNQILSDNVFLAILTSQCFHKPIDEEIQKYSPMRHSHFQDEFSQFQLANSPEKCNCSILTLFVKYQQFLHFRKNEGFMQTFFQLQIEPNFNQLLCTALVQNSNNFYRPFFEYQIKLTNSHKYTTKINSQQFQQYSYEKDLLKQILKSHQVARIIIKNGVFQSNIFEYMDFLHGDITLALLKLYKETKNNRYYQIFDLNSQNLLFMPLSNDSSYKIQKKFLYFLDHQFQEKQMRQLFDQICELLGGLTSNFMEKDSISGEFSQFRILQSQSLLIYALTRSFPCTPTEAEVFGFSTDSDYEAQKFEESIKIQNSVLTQYRNIIRIVCNSWNSEYQQYPQGFNNLMKIILNYYFNNVQSYLKLNDQNSPQIIFFKNQVLSDRNFISLLSAYLVNVSEPAVAYESLVELNDRDQHKLNLVLRNLMKRTILSLLVLGNQASYGQLISGYFRNFNSSEVSLEQVDLTYIQIYIFLFGANGINQIIDTYREISFHLKIQKNVSYLIYQIASTDHEYFQTINFCQQNKISEEYRKSLSKLFQTIFYASSFQSYKQFIPILQKISFENMMDYEQIILSSCELNQDNGQIELKQSIKPALYEPVFSNKIPELKELINNKLRDQDDYFTELFGSALQFELSQTNDAKSTLTQRRLIILKSISYDCQQQLLKQIVNELQNQIKLTNLNKIQQCLEENSVYINLLSIINRNLLPQNEKIASLLDQILSVCEQTLAMKNQVLQGKKTLETYVKLLAKQTIFTDEQEKQNKASLIQKKKQQLQKKFQQMSSKVQIMEQPDILQDSIFQNCSLCYLPFTANENIYRLILIQKTNLHQYYENISELNNFSSFFRIHISACSHQFHWGCLMNRKKQQISDHFFYQCSICKQPYNLLVNVQEHLENDFNSQIAANLNQYVQTLNKTEIEYLYSNYSKDNQFDINFLSNKIFTQAICNLIFQLFQDVKPFLLKQYHIILQTFIQILQHHYINGQDNLLKDAFSEAESILAKLINYVDQFVIQKKDPIQFTTSISQLLKQDECALLLQIFFEKNVQTHNEIRISPYNIYQLKTEKLNNLKTRFKINFKEFLVEHLLTPCQKKKCNFTKFPEYQEQTYAHQQLICLICFKKMCYNCKKNSKNSINSHSLKKHEGKTLFVLINSGIVGLITFSHFTYFQNSLFKSFIGEEPEIRCQGSEYYQRFHLNTKVIEEILDIILEERYLNVQFQNFAKIQKFED